MTKRAEVEPTAQELARCPRCGDFRKLVDVREEARTVGLEIAGDEPQFVIECCGYELSIEDDLVYKEVIALLQGHANQNESAGKLP